MITVIVGTNRRNSSTGWIAKYVAGTCEQKTNQPVELLSLEILSSDILHDNMYSSKGQTTSLTLLQDRYMIPAQKFIFVIPEYNGSFPGILKLFIDACSVRKYSLTFEGKKACLIGIASGRAGNLRGMDHLTDILHHLGTVVMPQKLPLSSMDDSMGIEGGILPDEAVTEINKQIQNFLLF